MTSMYKCDICGETYKSEKKVTTVAITQEGMVVEEIDVCCDDDSEGDWDRLDHMVVKPLMEKIEEIQENKDCNKYKYKKMLGEAKEG